MFSKMTFTIGKKLGVLAATAALGILLLIAFFVVTERSLVLEERKGSVQQAVEAAYNILAYNHSLAVKGVMSEEDAKRNAAATIRAFRYGDGEYFWINDMHPKMDLPVRVAQHHAPARPCDQGCAIAMRPAS